MINSQDIEFFQVVAGSPSLAAAARKLNVTPPSVSQRLQALERKLNVTLVDRNLRSTRLTSEGQRLAREGHSILLALEALQNDLLSNQSMIEGKLNVLAPLGFGSAYIAPLIAAFQQHYPNLVIELTLSDNPSWSHTLEPDVMIYIGQLRDSSLKCIHLANNRRFLLASPAYLASAPPLNTPEDLHKHACIALKENNEDVTMWKFNPQSRQSISIRIEPKLASNVGQVVKQWALAGHGVIQRSEWDVRKEIDADRLIPLLTDYALSPANIVALVSAEKSKRSRKLSLFLDYLKENLPRQW
ncbi:LysR family transcriptional regulator [Photobacterium sp. CCB-ST2H9]|uniref:LysR family transcriptional regulator n=1 Tax=unclassified Photobacterium TaxID=2628852 RepID=UPI002004701B|nr:LysR family transcriptional regulator [Photobacterium sp. CCB-ST2H9]UTM60025.1 LysR family transcriptional regulator [Photobacterium sp. CCB-ST2H9]